MEIDAKCCPLDDYGLAMSWVGWLGWVARVVVADAGEKAESTKREGARGSNSCLVGLLLFRYHVTRAISCFVIVCYETCAVMVI